MSACGISSRREIPARRIRSRPGARQAVPARVLGARGSECGALARLWTLRPVLCALPDGHAARVGGAGRRAAGTCGRDGACRRAARRLLDGSDRPPSDAPVLGRPRWRFVDCLRARAEPVGDPPRHSVLRNLERHRVAGDRSDRGGPRRAGTPHRGVRAEHPSVECLLRGRTSSRRVAEPHRFAALVLDHRRLDLAADARGARSSRSRDTAADDRRRARSCP